MERLGEQRLLGEPYRLRAVYLKKVHAPARDDKVGARVMRRSHQFMRKLCRVLEFGFFRGRKVAGAALGGLAVVFDLVIKKTLRRRNNLDRHKGIGFLSAEVIYDAHRGLPPADK